MVDRLKYSFKLHCVARLSPIIPPGIKIFKNKKFEKILKFSCAKMALASPVGLGIYFVLLVQNIRLFSIFFIKLNLNPSHVHKAEIKRKNAYAFFFPLAFFHALCTSRSRGLRHPPETRHLLLLRCLRQLQSLSLRLVHPPPLV